MRTTKEQIRKHINFIESYSNYKVEKSNIEKTTTYYIKLNNVTMAILKSNNNSDVWDMLEPFWKIAFYNKCDETKKRKMEV